MLERILRSGGIFMAWSDRDWILDGATVRVSMIGFDDGSQTEHTLDGETVAQIHANLTSEAETTSAKRLFENGGICFMGPSPKGPFDINRDVARSMLEAPLNVNGWPNSDVVRPVASGIDLVQESRGMWTIDFGTLPADEAAQYEAPFEYVKLNVRPVRTRGKRAQYGEKWWQYGRPRIEMRVALKANRGTFRLQRHLSIVFTFGFNPRFCATKAPSCLRATTITSLACCIRGSMRCGVCTWERLWRIGRATL